MAQAWMEPALGGRIGPARRSVAAGGAVLDPGLVIVLKLAGASLLVGVLLAVATLLVVPLALELRRPFAPGQLEAIVVKERAHSAYLATTVTPASGPRSGAALSQVAPPTAKPEDLPSADFGPGYYSYADADGEPDLQPAVPGGRPGHGYDPFNEWNYRTDSINRIFGGNGSAWDVQWALTHDFYAGPWKEGGDADGEGWWQPITGVCAPFTNRAENGSLDFIPSHAIRDLSVQMVFVNGSWHPRFSDIVSRDVLDPIDFQTPCGPRDGDGHRKHMRLYDIGHNPADGYWSVGTAHYDPDNHDLGSARFEKPEREVVNSFSLGWVDDPNPIPRWFVQEIWRVNLDNTGPRGCERPTDTVPPFDPDDPYRHPELLDPNDPWTDPPAHLGWLVPEERPDDEPKLKCLDSPDGQAYYIQLVA